MRERLVRLLVFTILSGANGAVWFGLVYLASARWAPAAGLLTMFVAFWFLCIARASDDDFTTNLPD